MKISLASKCSIWLCSVFGYPDRTHRWKEIEIWLHCLASAIKLSQTHSCKRKSWSDFRSKPRWAGMMLQNVAYRNRCYWKYIHTLRRTNMSAQKAIVKLMVLFQRRVMLVPDYTHIYTLLTHRVVKFIDLQAMMYGFCMIKEVYI